MSKGHPILSKNSGAHRTANVDFSVEIAPRSADLHEPKQAAQTPNHNGTHDPGVRYTFEIDTFRHNYLVLDDLVHDNLYQKIAEHYWTIQGSQVRSTF